MSFGPGLLGWPGTYVAIRSGGEQPRQFSEQPIARTPVQTIKFVSLRQAGFEEENEAGPEPRQLLPSLFVSEATDVGLDNRLECGIGELNRID